MEHELEFILDNLICGVNNNTITFNMLNETSAKYLSDKLDIKIWYIDSIFNINKWCVDYSIYGINVKDINNNTKNIAKSYACDSNNKNRDKIEALFNLIKQKQNGTNN